MILSIKAIFLLTVISCNPVILYERQFFYFAYGSNLLAKRIHIQNPSAIFYSPAKLENYRLDFASYFDPWRGPPATIVEDNDEVWGALWILDTSEMKNLDDQEGVDMNLYFAKNVTVTRPDGIQVLARTYQQTARPAKLNKYQDLPFHRRPSSTYLEVITLGAIESHLPAKYIAFLFSIPSNGQMASKEKRDQLGYPF